MGTPLARNTRQKAAIRQAFDAAGRPLSAQQVLSAARKFVAGVGMATVYRNVRALIQEGWLIPVDLPGGLTMYERSGKPHHHHFRCERCGRVYELEGCIPALHSLLPEGFEVDGHEIVLWGTCGACRRRLTAKR